jgi:hypothetical protein
MSVLCYEFVTLYAANNRQNKQNNVRDLEIYGELLRVTWIIRTT